MAMNKEALDVKSMLIPRSSGFVCGLQAYMPWRPLGRTKRNGVRRSTQRDAQFAAKLVDHAKDNDPRRAPDRIYYLGDGDKPAYVAGPDESLKVIAEGAGEHPAESFIRISSQVDGKDFFSLRHCFRSRS